MAKIDIFFEMFKKKGGHHARPNIVSLKGTILLPKYHLFPKVLKSYDIFSGF